MKTYLEFHGETRVINIEEELLKIFKKETKHFKILTGYGKSTGVSKSRQKVLTVLKKSMENGKIKGYFPADVKFKLLDQKSIYFESKLIYEQYIKKDSDYGNPGIIYVFL
ncbi:hypothetical protein BN85404900 [Alteracholeplasma palmae J233]|uniref:Smr domain-containing protein n=1 Tax=Alteracholeplasma palmae (strain ATCC 49389 / J233) TaxID=1318466 RepID=U4KKE6_ALTPJ|nr:hypothetical protein [Alteracholeplasma palmae]CCV64067.1 hypothetical protein BN85404900 [Alteracholeplasma palmae J233]